MIRQPEPKLSKVNEDEKIFYRSALFVKTGLQMKRERDVQHILFSLHRRKTHVGCSIFR
jgi:hypothetical protein